MKKIGLVDKAFLLKRTPLFRNVDLDIVLPAAEKAAVISYHPGEILFHEKEEGHHLFFIGYGKISLFTALGEKRILGPLSYFGEESLFSGKARGYSAKSEEESLLVTFTKNKLLQIISECPQVAIGFLECLGHEHPFPESRGDSYL